VPVWQTNKQAGKFAGKLAEKQAIRQTARQSPCMHSCLPFLGQLGQLRTRELRFRGVYFVRI